VFYRVPTHETPTSTIVYRKPTLQMPASTVDEGRTQSETISGLFQQLANLESRIFGGESPSERLIPSDQLERILGRAAASHSGRAQSAERLDLSGEVKRVIESEPETNPAGCLLSIRHAALLQIVEYLFRFLEYAADLDPDAYDAIHYLQLGLAKILIADPGALNRAEHPARHLLELLVGACKGYDHHAGPKAETLLEQAGRLVKAAADSPGSPEWSYGSAEREFAALLDAHERETLEFAKQMIAKERGEVMSSDAKVAVNREIIAAVRGKKLPLVLLQFLQQHWNKYLYVTYLRHGMQSTECRQGVEDIHSLVHSLRIRERNELFRFYAGNRAAALGRVRVGAASIHGGEALAKRFFATLDSIHKEVAEGELPEIEEIIVSTPDDLSESPATSPSDTESRIALDQLRVGHWYKLQERGLELRCKLIEKNPKHGYCLFSNYSGIKTARMEYTEAAQALRAGSLKQIDSSPIFGRALAFACRQIAEQIPKLESKAQAVSQEREKILSQKRRDDAEQNLRRLEEERLQEEARLLEERRSREREQARREAEAQAEARDEARRQALQQVLDRVNRMQPGGWVELIGDDNQKITCKLGLKLKSSGKLIFIDRLGRKVQDLLPEQLAERIVDGSAAIADYGVAFDDTLGRLITDRSEQVHAEQSG